MSRTINVGRVTSYADAVAGGYTGTREEWEIVLANLGTTAAEVEANRRAVAEDKAAVEGDVTTVGEYKDAAAQSASEAAQSAESAHTDALAATAAKEAAQTAQGIAEEARADAVSAKGAAESAQTEADTSASAAAGSALVAQNAAQTATTQAGAASDSATAAAASAASVSGVVAEVTAAKTEAITAIQTKGAETLDSIPDDYTELSNDVDDLKGAVNLNKIEFIEGYYLPCSTSPVDVSGAVANVAWKYAVLSVAPGDRFTVNLSGGTSPLAWCFIDDSGEIIKCSNAQAVLTNTVIAAPGGSTKMILNGKVADAPSYYGEKLTVAIDELENTVPKKAAAVYRTTPGSYDTVRITDGALDAPVRSALVTLPYNAEGYTGITLTQKTANILGGIDMANAIKAAISNAVINTDARTVRFGSAEASNKVLFDGFEPSKQYTFILTYANSSTTKASNTLIYYTDSTSTHIQKSLSIANQYMTARYVSNASKSVSYWGGGNYNGRTTIKYDESGIFEGVVELDEFTPPKNETYTADWTETAPGFYGGTYDFVTGELVQLYTDTGAATMVRYALPAHDVETGIGVNTFTVSAGTLKLDYQADTKKYVDDSATETKPVKATVLGYTATEDTYRALGADTAFADQITGVMTAWMTDYAGDAKKIPFVLHTDQHAMLTTARKWIFDLIDYCANWDQISAVFNLGDTVGDHWSDSTVMTDPLMRNQELENALLTVASIPKDKQINVFGNHDTWYTGGQTTAVSGVIPNLKYINPYFKTVGLRTVRYADNSGNMVIYDDQYHVRYIVTGGWDYADRDSGTIGYNYMFINAEHWKWIIDELSADCGYDIVIVTHVPLIWHSDVCYNPITGASGAGTVSYISSSKAYSAALFGARKAKAAGEITVNSEVIPYDFSGCKDKILCALSGHTHVDLVDRAGGLLVTAFDRFSAETPVVHFGLIDREANRLNVWKVSGGETPRTENWQAPFDVE